VLHNRSIRPHLGRLRTTSLPARLFRTTRHRRPAVSYNTLRYVAIHQALPHKWSFQISLSPLSQRRSGRIQNCAHEFPILLSSHKEEWGAVRLSFTARIKRGPSEGARSASKKDGLADPLILPLPHLALRPLPQPLNISPVLDYDQPCHNEREEDERTRRPNECGDDRKESKRCEGTA
jgi:hypothetical protein